MESLSPTASPFGMGSAQPLLDALVQHLLILEDAKLQISPERLGNSPSVAFLAFWKPKEKPNSGFLVSILLVEPSLESRKGGDLLK